MGGRRLPAPGQVYRRGGEEGARATQPLGKRCRRRSTFSPQGPPRAGARLRKSWAGQAGPGPTYIGAGQEEASQGPRPRAERVTGPGSALEAVARPCDGPTCRWEAGRSIPSFPRVPSPSPAHRAGLPPRERAAASRPGPPP